MVRGLGLTPVPRPERMYFVIGKPIDTRRYRDRHDAPDTLRRVRGRVERELLRLIDEGREYRRTASPAAGIRRLLNRL